MHTVLKGLKKMGHQKSFWLFPASEQHASFLQHPSPQCEVYSDRNELSDLLIIFSYKVFPVLTMHRTVESLTGLTGLT